MFFDFKVLALRFYSHSTLMCTVSKTGRHGRLFQDIKVDISQFSYLRVHNEDFEVSPWQSFWKISKLSKLTRKTLFSFFEKVFLKKLFTLA